MPFINPHGLGDPPPFLGHRNPGTRPVNRTVEVVVVVVEVTVLVTVVVVLVVWEPGAMDFLGGTRLN